jgi:hypothetical protein
MLSEKQEQDLAIVKNAFWQGIGTGLGVSVAGSLLVILHKLLG